MNERAQGAAGRIAEVLERLLGSPFPLPIRAWDGSFAAAPASADPSAVPASRELPTVVVRHRRAMRRLLWQADEVGLARGWVAGELDVEGDLEVALSRLDAVGRDLSVRRRLNLAERRDVLRDMAALGALGPPPPPPAEEACLHGTRHSKSRDRAAISHHYDIGNDFYRLLLGESMVYSCAYWTQPRSPAYGLADAQRDKLDLVCRKLGLAPGTRLLDVGCGWGSLAIHAAREHGARVVGVTLSREQADLARKRVAEAGLAEVVDIRLQDWRDLRDGPYDAIASIGMAEHVGEQGYRDYAASLAALLPPGGRLLNHQITIRPGLGSEGRTFIDAYVFPDGELLPLGTIVGLIETAGLEVRDVEGLREHYSPTLRSWLANLEGSWDAAVAAASPGRARVWQLYMTGSATAFDAGRIGVSQVLAVRPRGDGSSGLPATRREWLGIGEPAAAAGIGGLHRRSGGSAG